MFGVGLKILVRTPIPKLPKSYTPQPHANAPSPPKRFTPFKISLKVKFLIIKRIKDYLFKGKRQKFSKQKQR